MICGKKEECVREGDLVMLHGGYKFLTSCYIEKDGITINKFGAFRHNNIVGTRFGHLVQNTRNTCGLVVLRPTPELWSVSLRHRTQVVFSMDASVISFRLNLRPGSIVVETGTGSGSLSHHFVRCVQPNGHLHTFEFNKMRADVAREEFRKHKICPEFVTVKHADAYTDGFGDALKHRANAVFLDLPMPWKAILHAKSALAPNGMLCSFSPCVEQVQRTCSALVEAGFHDIVTIESLTRPFYVHDLADTGYSKGKRAQKRPLPKPADSATTSTEANSKQATPEPDAPALKVARPEDKQDATKESTAAKTETSATAAEAPAEDVSATAEAALGAPSPAEPATPKLRRPNLAFHHLADKAITTRPVASIRGHTSYLTFATIKDPTSAGKAK